ncbi:pregnancy-specific beta-1-glycoprotein 4-like isoform X2 [Denticeps clupeoides]|uniref:pregnancy-specific beta-1-glycoprotein 4-like isoform X2 n=1 Tax=Denticeps clupeoides TaxID=299321 RepID=UPI0010A2B1E3|nr:pregnancy-specific beta-1-glycoprotein 4-like isoform X2 [Denticeps clupeoides]
MATDKLLIFQVAFAVACLAQESTDNIPEPRLTYEWKNIFASESTVLKCKIQPESESWSYKWYRNGESLGENGNAYSVSSATKQNAGVYTCQGTHKKRNVTSKLSKAVELILSDLPTAQLNVESKWTKVFSTESVVMKCDIQPGSTDWRYKWYRNGQEVPDPTNGNKYSISRTNKEHSGEYTCQGVHSIRTVATGGSNVIQLTVDDLPVPQLTSEWRNVFSSQPVDLKCRIQPDSTHWDYIWYRNGQTFSVSGNVDTHSISSATKGHAGHYACQGNHRTRLVDTTETSKKFHLLVSDLPKPHLTLESKWTKVFPSEKVNMMCDIQPNSTDWHYKWYKNGQEFLYTMDGQKIDSDKKRLIQLASSGQSGNYTCVGKHKTMPVSTTASNMIDLYVYALPSASLTVDTSWTDILSVDSLTLLCEVHYKDNYGWNFTWFRDGTQLSDSFQERLSVKATEDMYQSEFQCKGFRTERPTSSTFSEAFKANNLVLKRKILLSISGCVITGIVVTFVCCIYLKCRRKAAIESQSYYLHQGYKIGYQIHIMCTVTM